MATQDIWTIGHSTHSLAKLLAMLNSFQIRMLVDIRRFPGSKRFPHFNQTALQTSLALHGIRYLHLRARRPSPSET